VFSDGGPAHFRLGLNFFLCVLLAFEFDVDLMWFFHMAYHGKGLYDPEGGAVKSILLHAIRLGIISITCAEEFCRAARHLCTSPSSQYEHSLWAVRTRHILLLHPTKIDRSGSEEWDVENIKYVHKTYCFRTVRSVLDGKINRRFVETREIGCRCRICLNFLSNCVHLNEYGPWRRQQFQEAPSKKRAKNLLEQLYGVLYSHFCVHVPSDAFCEAVGRTVNSTVGHKTAFRTRATHISVKNWFENRRQQDNHSEQCHCTRQFATRPKSTAWQDTVPPEVVQAAQQIMPTFLSGLSPVPVVPLPAQPLAAPAARALRQALVVDRDLIGRRFTYIFEGTHGTCHGIIVDVSDKFLHLRYDSDRKRSNAWETPITDVVEDYATGDFTLAPRAP
jgi:hypothetical protein